MKPEAEKETPFEESLRPEEAAQEQGVAGDLGADRDGAAAAGTEPADELAEATRRADENYDLFLRERAELENFKKRTVRDRVEAAKFAVEPLARDLLSIIDNLERAIEHGKASGEAPSVVEGVDLVLKSASDLLARHQVTRIDAVGQAFDPAVHEALAQVASDTIEANHVVEQFLPGYQLHDRLLRAAQVSVSTGPAAVEEE